MQSIPQALHGKAVAKDQQNWDIPEYCGNDIDRQLFEKCEQQGIRHYYILRYKDDYRIFSNEIETAIDVLKLLSEVLAENGGMRLSSEKTRVEKRRCFKEP